jgi:hypothetical protein
MLTAGAVDEAKGLCQKVVSVSSGDYGDRAACH